MLDRTADSGVAAVRAWTPHRQVAFGRRDARSDGYDRARSAAESRGYPAIERDVGGRAVAYTGTTVAFGVVVPIADARSGIGTRYDAAVTGVVGALRSLGVPARRGEPDASFCPGAHSVQARGKLSGIAQRVRRDAALVSGIVVVDARDELAAVLDPVYEALGVPFDPESVDSVAAIGGTADSEAVIDALVESFCGELQRRPVAVDSLSDGNGMSRRQGSGSGDRNRRA
ncbi:lipoyl protein ligase domain-containing protein [Halobellus sp. GM3]|uniref:lipoyl protein ligase domain-containing protein n=1 Tax=Halobellus sp. GM3 TaxID=3458410 RepID=UPI00403D8669